MGELKVIEERKVLNVDFKIYGDFENPLFLAKDVATWIEHSQADVMIRGVDDEEKVLNNVQTLGGVQEMWFLTEDGLYEVLMLSRKPIAKQFKKQVKNVLKEIRKTGSYNNTPSLPDFSNPAEAARAWALEYEAKQLALAVAEEKTIQLDESKKWASLKRYNFDEDMEYTSKQLSVISRKLGQLGYERKKVFDVNYGEVWAYKRAELDDIDFDAILDI